MKDYVNYTLIKKADKGYKWNKDLVAEYSKKLEDYYGGELYFDQEKLYVSIVTGCLCRVFWTPCYIFKSNRKNLTFYLSQLTIIESIKKSSELVGKKIKGDLTFKFTDIKIDTATGICIATGVTEINKSF